MMGLISQKIHLTDRSVEEPLLDEKLVLPQTILSQRYSRSSLLFHVALVLCYSIIFLFSWLYLQNSYAHGAGLIYGEHYKKLD
jgi:hypothetical protein